MTEEKGLASLSVVETGTFTHPSTVKHLHLLGSEPSMSCVAVVGP